MATEKSYCLSHSLNWCLDSSRRQKKRNRKNRKIKIIIVATVQWMIRFDKLNNQRENRILFVFVFCLLSVSFFFVSTNLLNYFSNDVIIDEFHWKNRHRQSKTQYNFYMSLSSSNNREKYGIFFHLSLLTFSNFCVSHEKSITTHSHRKRLFALKTQRNQTKQKTVSIFAASQRKCHEKTTHESDGNDHIIAENDNENRFQSFTHANRLSHFSYDAQPTITKRNWMKRNASNLCALVTKEKRKQSNGNNFTPATATNSLMVFDRRGKKIIGEVKAKQTSAATWPTQQQLKAARIKTASLIIFMQT